MAADGKLLELIGRVYDCAIEPKRVAGHAAAGGGIPRRLGGGDLAAGSLKRGRG